VNLLRRWWRRLFGSSRSGSDPYSPDAGVRVPKRPSPGGRSSAVAVLEPDGPSNVVDAIGRRRT